MIVFDSCRFDTFAAARTPNISRLGETHRRYSFASWTVPSHAVYLLGASPHSSPRGVFASEVYKKDFVNWGTRLNIPDISFRGFVPQLSLPAFLRSHGYRTNALVSMPVLNQTTILNQHFDRYQLMKSHNDFSAIIDELTFSPDEPNFYLLNIGETHYPYTLPGEKAPGLPIIHGVHGVFKHMDDLVMQGSDEPALSTSGPATSGPATSGPATPGPATPGPATPGPATPESPTPGPSMPPKAEEFFDMDTMNGMKEKQRTNIEFLDRLFEKLYQVTPRNTHFMVMSDHGEAFGEDGYFGHGPVMHEKVFEVFFVDGMLK